MNVVSPMPVGHVQISLDAEESIQVYHPRAILAFQGKPTNREDRIMNMAGIYRKKRFVCSRISGAGELVLGLPEGCSLETIDIPPDSDLLFDFRHVLFHTDGLGMKTRIQTLRNAWITRKFTRMRFSGPGMLGVITTGTLVTLQLDPEKPLFVDAGALVAYPERASVKLSVYGNSLASQHMNVQFEMTGHGPVLLQSGSADMLLQQELRNESWLRRVLRELLPFGGVYIK
ncbi:hypothetical protein DUZ99_13160 [Xylanibacillus composti]|uniref:AIM24 family protein n=1 Tax=Xylanibacillus composti TaxID=1572762 RepID=A0A8J4H7M1_9BACL|nr:AIM24 family protein [Xylanibacillus composti]MDT9725923.1 hypothetical protein [Xylanibacillus composti]GIQ71236.1 hypothetical protein XYCOK13_40600 [Xylanibacillus composti]